MTPEEYREKQQMYSQRFDARIQRTKNLCIHRAPKPIIDHSKQMVLEAIDELRAFSEEYGQHEQATNEVIGTGMIKRAFEAEEVEAFEKESEENWARLTNELVGLVSEKLDPATAESVVTTIIDRVKAEALLL